MADKNDQNPVNNISGDILLAQAKPKPDPRPDLRVIPGGRSVPPKVPPTVSIPKLPRTPGSGGLNPWAIFFVEILPRIFEVKPAGNVRGDEKIREENQRRSEAEKQRQSTQTDQKPSGTQQKPAQTPQQNPPVFYTPDPIPDYVPSPIIPTPIEIPSPPIDIERQLRVRKAQEAAADKQREESLRAERRRQEQELDKLIQSQNDDSKAFFASSDRKAAINNIAFELRFKALSSNYLNSDELFKLSRIWDNREGLVRKIFDQQKLAFDKWKIQNPLTPEHKWLNSEGRKYEQRAVDLLKRWIQEDKKADSAKKTNNPPKTAEQINKERQQQRVRKNQQVDGTVASNTTTASEKNPDKDPRGENPKKKDKSRSNDRWSQATDVIKRDLEKRNSDPNVSPGDKEKYRAELNALESNLDRLKTKGINPATIEKVHKSGIRPSELETHLNQVVEKNKVNASFQELADLMLDFSTQIQNNSVKVEGSDKTRTARLKNVKQAINRAVSDESFYKWTKEIINSGKLKNPEELAQTLENAATQIDPSARKGKELELELTAKLVTKEKSNVVIEKGADIIDLRRKIAWQVKNADGVGQNNVSRVLQEAANQITGTNETVPKGNQKAIYIRISDANNPEYKKSSEQLRDFIQDKLNEDHLKEINQVQIEIDKKVYQFDIKDGIVKYRRSYSSERLLVDENTSRSTYITKSPDSRSQLLTALKNYDKVSESSRNPDKVEVSRYPKSSDITFSLLRTQLNLHDLNKEQEAKAEPVEQPVVVAQARQKRNDGIGGL
jgi:hypothetical protein